MPKRKLSNLSPEARAEVERRLNRGDQTYEQIAADINALGEGSTSKSAVGRVALDLKVLNECTHYAGEIGKALGKKIDLEVTSDLGRVITNMLQGAVLKAAAEEARGGELSVETAHMLADIHQKVARSEKYYADITTKVEDRLLKKAAAATEKISRELGLTGSTVDAIKASILGIRDTRDPKDPDNGSPPTP